MSQPRILHASDLHFGLARYGTDPATGLPRDYLSARQVLSFIASTAIEREVDALILSGDQFDKGAPAMEAVLAMAEILRDVVRSGIAVVIVGGNHENIGLPVRFRSANALLADMLSAYGTVRVADAAPAGILLPNGIQVAAMPWLDKPKMLNALGIDPRTITGSDAALVTLYVEHFESMMNRVNTGMPIIAASHVTVDASIQRGSELELCAHLFSEPIIPARVFDDSPAHYAALGHIHTAADVGRIGRYAGSANRLTFADAGVPKTISLVTLDPSGSKVEQIPTPAMLLQRLDVDSISDARPAAVVELTLPVGLSDPDPRHVAAIRDAGAVLHTCVRTPAPPSASTRVSIHESASAPDAMSAWLDAHHPDADKAAVLAAAREVTSA